MWLRSPGCFRFPASDPNADVCIFGAPFDGTASGHAGSRFAPQAIREASEFLETYSPRHDRDTESVAAIDVGDLELPFGNKVGALNQIKAATELILDAQQRPMMLGGEHLCTLPVIQVLTERYPDLVVLQLDAHTDLREEYLGETLSHATVMRRALEHLSSPQDLITYGIRSGLKEEFELLNQCRISGAHHSTSGQRSTALRYHLEAVRGRPLYITLDLDVFDPSLMPGTGTPEPGGIFFDEWIQIESYLKMQNIVGVDIVELCPSVDVPSKMSAILAAKMVRELLFTMTSNG